MIYLFEAYVFASIVTSIGFIILYTIGLLVIFAIDIIYNIKNRRKNR